MTYEQFPRPQLTPAEQAPTGKTVSAASLEAGQISLTHGGERITYVDQQADGTFVVMLERSGRLLLDRDETLEIA